MLSNRATLFYKAFHSCNKAGDRGERLPIEDWNFAGRAPMATIHIKPQQTDIYVMDGTILRDALLKNSIDIYKGMAKLLNCGGVGQCGTCVVEILTGAEQLSERTAVEEQKLRNKPVSYRLACQTVVSGELGVRVKP